MLLTLRVMSTAPPGFPARKELIPSCGDVGQLQVDSHSEIIIRRSHMRNLISETGT
ncbi:hypothetical protein SAMN05421684_7954 [Asanoa ishikariensis]|uniref:Uncharacterized protein n=1 Tax=Asanoa ishikariensis TaxID=137265 RepID=A0A1H3US58_9ACTN|nr:hypothetical protein SAMN05421684_7954 [Asanoa ishikariensis]